MADAPGLPRAPPATHSPRCSHPLHATVVPDGRPRSRQLQTPSRSRCYVILEVSDRHDRTRRLRATRC